MELAEQRKERSDSKRQLTEVLFKWAKSAAPSPDPSSSVVPASFTSTLVAPRIVKEEGENSNSSKAIDSKKTNFEELEDSSDEGVTTPSNIKRAKT